MEEEIIKSSVSKVDVSDASSSNSGLPTKSKTTSTYKGVVPQANGHFGAQIYGEHRRIWLGTFKTELAAAAFYDSAALKVKPGNSHRNIPLNASTIHESTFQKDYSTDEVLEMIKNGTYQVEFNEFLAKMSQLNYGRVKFENKKDGQVCKELFRKELTPSDVGKLNRLVIPTRYANQYFNTNDVAGESFGSIAKDESGIDRNNVDLVFYDESETPWTFRYSFWKSSSSFVFTRGWSCFVKAKALKAKYIVVFYLCHSVGNNVDGNELVKKYYKIDIIVRNSSQLEGDSAAIKRNFYVDDDLQVKKIKFEDKGIKLFGVQIVPRLATAGN